MKAKYRYGWLSFAITVFAAVGIAVTPAFAEDNDSDEVTDRIGVNAGNINDARNNYIEAKQEYDKQKKVESREKWDKAVDQYRQQQDEEGKKAVAESRKEMTSKQKAEEWNKTVDKANQKADAAGERAIKKVQNEQKARAENIRKGNEAARNDQKIQDAANEKLVKTREMEKMSPQEKINEWNKVKAADSAKQDAANEALMRGETPPAETSVRIPKAKPTTPTTVEKVKAWGKTQVEEFNAGIKSGKQELKGELKKAGIYLKGVEIGDNMYKIMSTEDDLERLEKAGEAGKSVGMDAAQAVLGKSAPALALGLVGIEAGTKASENYADYRDYERDVDGQNYNVGVKNREEKIFQDLARKDGGGLSKEEARRLALGYVNGEEKSIEKVDELYKTMGKDVPELEQAERTWKQATLDYGADAFEAGGNIVKGVVQQGVNTGKAIYQGGAEVIGVLTEKGAMGEWMKDRGESLSGENLSAGAEVIGGQIKEKWNEGMEKVDESVEYIKDAMGWKSDEEKMKDYVKDKVKSWGVSDVYADKVLEKYFNAKTLKEKAEIMNEAKNEIKSAQEARAKAKEAQEAENNSGEEEAKDEDVGSLRDSEGGELPEPGKDGSIAADPGGGSFGGFTHDRETQRATDTAEDRYFGDSISGERQQEGWNLRSEMESRRVLEESGTTAGSINMKSAAESATAQDKNSWGSAVADGVQTGINVGFTALGAGVGGAIGDEIGRQAADSVFNDSHHGDQNPFGGSGLLDDDWKPKGESTAKSTEKSTEKSTAKSTATSSGKSSGSSSGGSGKCVRCGKKLSAGEVNSGYTICISCEDKETHGNGGSTSGKNPCDCDKNKKKGGSSKTGISTSGTI